MTTGNISAIERSCAVVIDHVDGIVKGRIKTIGKKLQSQLERAIDEHLEELEVRVALDVDPKKNDIIHSYAELMLDLFGVPVEATSVVYKEATSFVQRPKPHRQQIVQEVRYRAKSTLSDLVKAVIIHVTGRTFRSYDRRGLKAVIKAPETPLVDFMKLYETADLDAMVSLMSAWEFGKLKDTEQDHKRAFVTYLTIANYERFKNLDPVLVQELGESYYDSYQRVGNKKPQVSRAFAEKYRQAKLWEDFKTIFLEDTSKAQRVSARTKFLESLQKDNSTDHLKKVLDLALQVATEQGLRLNPTEMGNKIGQYRSRLGQIKLDLGVARRINCTEALTSIAHIREAYEQETARIARELPFARSYPTQEHWTKDFFFNDVFLPIYKRHFEQANIEVTQSYVQVLLSGSEREIFGELLEIGPRRLLYYPVSKKSEPTPEPERLVAIAQDFSFADTEKNYRVIFQKWNNSSANEDYFRRKRARTNGKEYVTSRRVLKKHGFEPFYFEEHGQRHLIVMRRNLSLELIIKTPQSREEELFLEEQLICYAQSIDENITGRKSLTASNRQPGERGISIMEIVMSPSQKPAGSALDYADFPTTNINRYGLHLMPDSHEHQVKDNVAWPKPRTGFQAYKMVFKGTTEDHGRDEGFELIVVTPLMQWDQKYGRSKHDTAYKGKLLEDVRADAEAIFGLNPASPESQHLKEYFDLLVSTVAQRYVQRLEHHQSTINNLPQNEERHIDDPASIARVIQTLDELYHRFRSEFPSLDLQQHGITTLKNVEEVRHRIEQIPQRLINLGCGRQTFAQAMNTLDALGYKTHYSI